MRLGLDIWARCGINKKHRREANDPYAPFASRQAFTAFFAIRSWVRRLRFLGLLAIVAPFSNRRRQQHADQATAHNRELDQKIYF
jgi:hypothetical protein